MIMHAQAGGKVLCVAPTRELAQQCAVRIKALAKYTQLSVCLVVPEAKTVVEVISGELTTNTADSIVIGTPGAVRNMTRPSKKFSMMVVDEADKMLDPEEGKRYGGGGRGNQMGTMRDQNLQIKNTFAASDCQVLLFSATFSELIVDFSRQMAKNFVMINTDKNVEEYNLKGLKYLSLNCESRGKFKALTECYAIMSISQSVVFTNSKQTANKLKEDMEQEGYTVSILHGDVPPAQRDATMDDFRSQATSVLIATDVFARGIDVKTINVVINYDIPGNGEDYYHRVGRACRFGRKGVAINLVESSSDRHLLNEIARGHGLECPIIEFDPKTLDQVVKAFLAK
jgi:superfamily II DNA/RNA helicase